MNNSDHIDRIMFNRIKNLENEINTLRNQYDEISDALEKMIKIVADLKMHNNKIRDISIELRNRWKGYNYAQFKYKVNNELADECIEHYINTAEIIINDFETILNNIQGQILIRNNDILELRR